MHNYPQLGFPEAWKPLFRALHEAEWELLEVLPVQPGWAARPVLVFHRPMNPECGMRYLSFFTEPVWCGNKRQDGGFTIVGASGELPLRQSDAEAHTLGLTGDWEAHAAEFVREIGAMTVGA